MNSKSGDNGQLSSWGRWKTKLAKLWSWLRAHSGLFIVGFIITSTSLIFSIYCHFVRHSQHKEIISNIKSHYKEIISQNKEFISFMTNRFQEQNKFLENLLKGNFPSLMPFRDTPRNGASVSRGSITVTSVGIAPKQFIVTGKLDRITKEKGWWIGTLSGLRVWPQIELPPEIGEGELFKYRVTIPPNIDSGELVLIEAGSKANQLFKDQMMGQYYQVGLFAPHLKDAQVIASVDFH